MAKQLRCRDVGMNCEFEARADTEEELLRQAAAHARDTHQITEMSPELANRVRAAIRTV
jgi:predicted small metal-binding protein